MLTTDSSIEQSLEKNFKEAGFKPQVQKLAFFQDDYGLKGQEGEDDIDDQEEEDEDSEGEEGDSEEDSGSDEDEE